MRENNEDNIHLWPDEAYVVAVVADGMGGAAAGEEASRLAVESIEQGLLINGTSTGQPLLALSDDHLSQKMREAVAAANLNIVRRAANEPELRGMGTTVTLAFVRETHVLVAHVGDSRAYLISGKSGDIDQITADHSFVEALVAAGHLTQEQAEEHPMRNVLYRALGQHETVDVDIYSKAVNADDRLVLCSDGLTRHVKPAEIADVAHSESDPEIASQKLIDLANARGGEDNVSVIVVKIEWDDPLEAMHKHDAMLADDDTQDVNAVDDEDTVILQPLRTRTSPNLGGDKPENVLLIDATLDPHSSNGDQQGKTCEGHQPDSDGEGRDPLAQKQ
ncbi:MAG: Stp1/IreP family PP2C-type Ser/Thr phosphatase [Chloroflexi bacterium]|nr:Stp1/IreP family PP2C-type Ser/Thr phosphatase [Chloroflexota bacterium]